MKILKVSLIILASVIGAVGIILLGLFLAGKFNEPVNMPNDIFFARSVVLEDGTSAYEEFEGDFKTSGNYDVILSTKTEEVNKRDVSLYFNPRDNVIKFLKKDAESVSANFYAYENNELSKFVTCKEDEADYVTNGRIILPKTVKLNKTFTVLVCVAPDDEKATVISNTPLYAICGESTFYAQSENVNVTAIKKSIYVDTPVSEIKLELTTRNGGNETALSKVENSYVVDLETYFTAKTVFVPARSEYLYGNSQNKKQVVLALNNDENKVSFVDANDVVVETKVATNNVLFSNLTGKATIFAYAFKNASDYENLEANISNDALFVQMQNANKAVTTSTSVQVSKIPISGFSVDEELLDDNTSLNFEINKAQIITANGNSASNVNLGINIDASGYSAGTIQNEIQNIYLSIQVLDGDEWVDATKTLFAISGSDVLTVEENDSSFDFYKINYNSRKPNESYWEIVPLSENESISGKLQMVVCYFYDDVKFGPYTVNCETSEVVETITNWGETNLKFSNELSQGETNEKIFYVENGVASFVTFDLSTLVEISNLRDNPTYTLIKFFVYSTDSSLETKLNCKKYNYEVSGIPSFINGEDVYIYEILSEETLRVFSMGDKSSFAFNLFYALVKNDSLDNAILNDDGSYKIISLSNNNQGVLVYIPITISKIVDLSNDCLNVTLLKNLEEQFGEDEGKGYVLQRTEDCLSVSIKIKEEDFEIFARQVELGNIALSCELEDGSEFAGLYLKSEDGNISLENALAYVLENNTFTSENGIKTVTFNLSTNSITFDSNETTKFVRIKLNYSATFEGLQNPILISRSTSIFKIYSGKINTLSIEVTDEEGYDIANKTISVSNSIENDVVVRTFEIGDKTLNFANSKIEISYTKFGINDEIEVESNRPDIMSVDSNNVFSVLKSGEVTLTIKPKYSTNEDDKIEVRFSIVSNFEIIPEDLSKRADFVKNNKSKGVISYANGTYTIVGIQGNLFNLTDMVGLKLKIGENETDITDKLTFTLAETDEDLLNYVNFEGTTFAFTRNFGVPASLTIYYYNTEYGFNSGVLQITIAPYYIADVNLNDDEDARNYADASTLESAEVDAKFVFAEHDIDFSSFKIYKWEDGEYAEEQLSKFILFYNNSFFDNDTSVEDSGICLTSKDLYLKTFNFNATSKVTKKTLTVKQHLYEETTEGTKEVTTKYDFKVTYVFYVVPNIKVADAIENKIDENGVYHLNDKDNPYKNENIISWSGTSPTISFERIFNELKDGSLLNPLYDSLFKYTFEDSTMETGTSITLSGVKCLSEKTLSVFYAGKEFKFVFYVEPNISPSIENTITYNGENYITLYAGENISSLTNANADFGNLASGNNIVSVNVLQSLVDGNIYPNKNYKLFDESNITLTLDKNYLLFITNIVFASGDEYITRKAIIFPEKWSYISYFNSENQEISGLTVDDVLTGKVVKDGNNVSYNSIENGKDISNFASILNGKNYSYKIYNITNGEELIFDSKSSVIRNTDYISVENNVIKTKYSGGENRTYRIDFIISYNTSISGLESFDYGFSYYITVISTQEIEINYPHGNSELHRIYYAEFGNSNVYTIDLEKNKNNLQNKNYVVLKNGENKLLYEVQLVKVNGLDPTIENIVSVNEKGVVTINNFGNVDSTIYAEIRVYTNTGTENVYKIQVCHESFNNYVVFGSYTKTSGDPETTEIINKKFDLKDITEQTVFDGYKLLFEPIGDNKVLDISMFKLYDKNNALVSSQTLKFAFVDNYGVVQIETKDLAYIKDGKLIVKPSPNTVSGKLVFYTSEGIILTTNVTVASPIVVTQVESGLQYITGENIQAKSIYAGQTIDLTDYVYATFNGTQVTTDLTYNFYSDASFENKITLNNNQCAISSTNEGYALTIYVEVYGNTDNDLPGTSSGTPATLTLTFNVAANIVVQNQTIEVFANESDNTIQLVETENVFNLVSDTGLATINNTNGIIVKSIDLSSLSKDEKEEAWFNKYCTGTTYSEDALKNEIATISNTNLSFKSGPVAVRKTIPITLTLTTSDGETFDVTLNIVVKPDTSVVINYPTYETGVSYDYHLISWDDWENAPLTILNGELVVVNDISGAETPTHTTELKCSNTTNVEIFETTGIKLKDTKPNKELDIAVQVYVDGIFRENYYIKVRPSAVFTAKFNNEQNDITENLVDNSDSKTANLFNSTGGLFYVKTQANRAGSYFDLTIVAVDKRTGEEYKVVVYGKGEVNSICAQLYKNATIENGQIINVETPFDGTQVAKGTTPETYDYEYTLAQLFVDETNVANYIDMFNFYIEPFTDEYVGSDKIFALASDVHMETPTQRLTFFFNGNQIPLAVAKDLVELYKPSDATDNLITDNLEPANNIKLDAFKLSDLGTLNANTTYTIKFKLAGGNKSKLATYNVMLKKDYLIASANYDVIKNNNTTTGSANESYNQGEFSEDKYGALSSTNTLKVLSTIELAVSDGEKDLIDLLKQNFSLSALNGGKYGNDLNISLAYGNYKTNINAYSSILSLQAKTNENRTYSYAITPHGAQNDGDIVHLVLSWNNGNVFDADTYILRIKIIPNDPIALIEQSGIMNVAYNAIGGNATLSNDNCYEIPLANLVTLNGITENDVIVAVGDGSQYVFGEGSNKLTSVKNPVGPGNVQGIKLKKTIFGGNVIELTISDSFGYSVELNIIYSNQDETSPTIISNPSSIYEGESFTLAFDVGGGQYVVYGKTGSETSNTWRIVQIQENQPNLLETDYSNIIKIGNFDKATLKGLLGISGSSAAPTLSTYSLSASKVSSAFNSGNNVVKANYISNTCYRGGISISGDELGLKLVLEVTNDVIGGTERVELPISTALNERYQIRLKDDYANYANLYLGLGNSYGFTDIFKIWDLKEQADASGVSFSDFGIENSDYFDEIETGEPSVVVGFTTKNSTEETMTFTNKLHEIGNVQFTMNVGENIHKLTYNVYFTPKYYAISYPSTYNANYGVVVDGNASTTSSTTFTDWKNNFKLLDYYGNEVGSNSSLSSDGITLENFQGTGNVSGTTISGLSADSPITIAVKSNNVQIGTVLVTMRRYYALTGGATANENYTNTNTLDFDVWANGIKAFVVGGTASESIPRGLSHFDFIAPSGYSVIYTGGEYKLRKLSGNFTAGDIQIAVKYLGTPIGTIKVTISSSNVVASVVTS